MAATQRQLAEICERIFALPTGSVITNTDKLRQAGILSKDQSKPTAATPREAALMVLAAIVGTPMRHQPTIAEAYYDCRESGWGATLGDRLAAILSGTSEGHILSLRVDLSAPGATLLVADGPFGVPEKYISDDEWPRPAFEREATVRGDLIRRIAHEIKTAPEVKKGRRKSADKWKT